MIWSGEICKVCNRRNPIGFIVSDDVWNKVIGKNIVVCPTCFDEKADLKNVEYRFMEIFPISWSMWEE